MSDIKRSNKAPTFSAGNTENVINQSQQNFDTSSFGEQKDYTRPIRPVRSRWGNGSNSGRLSEINKFFQELLEGSKELKDDGFSIVPIAAESIAASISSIAFCCQMHNQVHYFLLMLDANLNLSPRTSTIGQEKVEIPTVTSDLNSVYLHNLVKEYLANYFSTATGRVQVRQVGTNIIDKSIDAKDTEVLKIFFENSFDAIDGKLSLLKLPSPEMVQIPFISAEQLTSGNQQLKLNVRFNQAPGLNSNRHPVRKDVTIDVNLADQKSNKTEIAAFVYDTLPQYTHCGMYVDLIYNPPQQNELWTNGTAINAETFTPNVILTDLSGGLPFNSLPNFIMTLASAFTVSHGQVIFGSFRPNKQLVTEFDPKDIGGAAYKVKFDYNQPKFEKVDTKSANFTDNDLQDYLNRIMRKNAVFTLPIHETSNVSWMTELFLLDARNSQGSIAARNTLIECINVLTKGNFSSLWSNTQQMCIVDEMRRPSGYFNSNGRLADIAELDTLAILNTFGSNQPDVIDEWINIQNDTSVPADIRTDKLIKFYNGATHETFEQTGYFRHVTFTTAFINALTQALVNSGISFSTDPTRGLGSSKNQSPTWLGQVTVSTGVNSSMVNNHAATSYNGVSMQGGIISDW